MMAYLLWQKVYGDPSCRSVHSAYFLLFLLQRLKQLLQTQGKSKDALFM